MTTPIPITALPAAAALTGTEIFPLVQTAVTKQSTLNAIKALSAPVDATYVTMTASSGLSNERVLKAGTNVTIVDGGANSTVTISATGSGSPWSITDGVATVIGVTNLFSSGGVITDLGGTSAAITTAPPGASYLTLGNDGVLTNERVLTAGTNVSFVDTGANGTLTINSTAAGGTSTLQGEEFTASGTFTPDTGVTSVWITMIGGGGSGSGSDAAAQYAGSGGGSGEHVQGMLVAVSGAVTVTIGAGGTPTGATGGNGGNTSFGVFVARGGYGGVKGDATTTVVHGGAGGGFTGGIGGKPAAQAGDVGVIGTAASPTGFGGSGGGGGGATTATAGAIGGGSMGFAGGPGGAVASSQAGGGGGGSSPWGIGATGGDGGATGGAATNYGTGGGGGGGKAASSTGGVGAAGYCLVTWIGP